jgi:hypothetical protein
VNSVPRHCGARASGCFSCTTDVPDILQAVLAHTEEPEANNVMAEFNAGHFPTAGIAGFQIVVRRLTMTKHVRYK